MLTDLQKDQVIYLCKELVRIPSYSGEEKSVAENIKKYAYKHGFDEIEVDKLGNVILTMNGEFDGPTILFDGHIDTVPAEEEKWNDNPFSGKIIDNKIYGRGSSDMKGAVSAMISAAINFSNQTQKKFKGKIVISCSVHEEQFEGVATREISKLVRPNYVVIGEATGLNLNHGQRGRAEIVIETIGKPAHSSNPDKGTNAVYNMMKLIDKIKSLPLEYNEVLGEGILELTDIISSPYPGMSVVPSYCKVTYDRRLLVEETKESVLLPIEKVIDELKKENNNFNAKVFYSVGQDLCYTGEKIMSERFFPAWLYDRDANFITEVFNELKQVIEDVELDHYSFCTNGSHFSGEKNIPTIGFGPSYEYLAHIDDEYIELEQLIKATEGYFIIMKALSKIE